MSLVRTSPTRVFSTASSIFCARCCFATPLILARNQIRSRVHIRVQRRGLRYVSDAPFDLKRLLEDVKAGHARRAFSWDK